jgi:hypothetical protein
MLEENQNTKRTANYNAKWTKNLALAALFYLTNKWNI